MLEGDKIMNKQPLTISTKLEVPSGNDEAQSENTPELTNREKPQEKSLRFPESEFL